jgi:hydrogenase maturation protease
MKTRTLLLGLGNPILSDDGVGIRVALAIEAELGRDTAVDVVDASVGGLGLLDLVTGYDRLIVIDSIKQRGGKPGEVYRLELSDLDRTIHSSNAHDTNFATALEFGRQCGLPIPEEIVIYAIQIHENTEFGEDLTPSVEKAIPRIVRTIMNEQGLSEHAVCKA